MKYLTSEQIHKVHSLYHFLRKLQVIGLVHTKTTRVHLTDSGKPIRYHLEFVSYDASFKNKLTPEESITGLFDRPRTQS